MANLLWGKVYFNDMFAGFLREEPGDRITFTYDNSYISAENPAIAHTLPVREAPHISNNGLHPFFDNLVSEGWLEHAQSRLLGKREVKRFELLLAFGFDCAGAVSVIDPEPSKLTQTMLDIDDPKEMAVLTSRASLSGVQPKLTVIEENGIFRPTRLDELSTYIAKFPSSNHPDLIENEYLTSLAFKALLPDNDIVELSIGEVKGLDDPALLIKRFDRVPNGRIHFEEFNQLLDRRSNAKYTGAHKDMAEFILQTDGCLPTQAYMLYRRILAGLLLGNTDMHFKNFAMLHTTQGLRFTPSYDQVAASLYQYKTVALSIAGASALPIGNLKPANMIRLGEEFDLSPAATNMAVNGIIKNLDMAKQAISDADFGSDDLKNNLIKLMEKRWNGTFALIGKTLSKKP
jgi:serine/threonine-protein kinase HipA